MMLARAGCEAASSLSRGRSCSRPGRSSPVNGSSSSRRSGVGSRARGYQGATTLAGRERADPVTGELTESHQSHQVCGSAFLRFRDFPPRNELGRGRRPREYDGGHVEVGAHRQRRVDPADAAAQLAEIPGPQPGSEQKHPAIAGELPTAENAQQAGLAGTVGAEQRPVLARTHRERDVVQHGRSVPDPGDGLGADDVIRSAR